MVETYLVGGSVRDNQIAKIHGERSKRGDRDYVVVGSTWDQMVASGKTHVGKHFPVFLDPVTKEEYALARREKKVADGHGGFEFDFSPDVTIEEDLHRRDFTMNALAIPLTGGIVHDPCGGIRDIENRVIRHIDADAFKEDPLRVFRAARFAAQLGFRIYNGTLWLMEEMAASGELATLPADRVWKETEKALASQNPSAYFRTLIGVRGLEHWFPELLALHGVPQRADHHPEVDTFLHTMMTLDACTKLTRDPVVRWSLVCHDLGKALTDPDIWPKHYEHEKLGIEPCTELCKRLGVPNEYRDFALLVTEHHIRCHCIMGSRNGQKPSKPGKIVKLLDKLHVKHGIENLFRFTTACMADARGRLGKEGRRYRDAAYLHAAALAYLSVKPRKDVEGKLIGQMLFDDRAQEISKLRNRFPMTD